MFRSIVAGGLMVALAFSIGCSPEAAKQAADKAAAKAKEATSEVGAELANKATEALSGVEGGSDMLKQATEMFGKLTGTLSEVKDADTANNAVGEITKLTEGFGGMTDMFGKMPDAAKSAVAGVFGESVAKLKPIIEKVMAIPGVEAVLKPAIDGLMSKLEAFKA